MTASDCAGRIYLQSIPGAESILTPHVNAGRTCAAAEGKGHARSDSGARRVRVSRFLRGCDGSGARGELFVSLRRTLHGLVAFFGSRNDLLQTTCPFL